MKTLITLVLALVSCLCSGAELIITNSSSADIVVWTETNGVSNAVYPLVNIAFHSQEDLGSVVNTNLWWSDGGGVLHPFNWDGSSILTNSTATPANNFSMLYVLFEANIVYPQRLGRNRGIGWYNGTNTTAYWEMYPGQAGLNSGYGWTDPSVYAPGNTNGIVVNLGVPSGITRIALDIKKSDGSIESSIALGVQGSNGGRYGAFLAAQPVVNSMPSHWWVRRNGHPESPSSVSASRGTMGGVTLFWVGNPADTNYLIYRSESNDTNTAVLIATTSDDPFIDSGATAGTNYFYWVSSESTNGVSPFSTPSASGTTPIILGAPTVGNPDNDWNHFTLSWTNFGDQNYFIENCTSSNGVYQQYISDLTAESSGVTNVDINNLWTPTGGDASNVVSGGWWIICNYDETMRTTPVLIPSCVIPPPTVSISGLVPPISPTHPHSALPRAGFGKTGGASPLLSKASKSAKFEYDPQIGLPLATNRYIENFARRQYNSFGSIIGTYYTVVTATGAAGTTNQFTVDGSDPTYTGSNPSFDSVSNNAAVYRTDFSGNIKVRMFGTNNFKSPVYTVVVDRCAESSGVVQCYGVYGTAGDSVVSIIHTHGTPEQPSCLVPIVTHGPYATLPDFMDYVLGLARANSSGSFPAALELALSGQSKDGSVINYDDPGSCPSVIGVQSYTATAKYFYVTPSATQFGRSTAYNNCPTGLTAGVYLGIQGGTSGWHDSFLTSGLGFAGAGGTDAPVTASLIALVGKFPGTPNRDPSGVQYAYVIVSCCAGDKNSEY